MPLSTHSGSQQSFEHIIDRLKHHRFRRDPLVKPTRMAPHALIVDDDVESIQPLQIVLYHLGFETAVVFDGKMALEEMSKRNFDIMFLDINMPIMDGRELLKRMNRRDAKFNPRSVVFYSSTGVDKDEFSQAKNFTFAGHWKKPLTLADLATLAANTIEELHLKGGLYETNSRLP